MREYLEIFIKLSSLWELLFLELVTDESCAFIIGHSVYSMHFCG